MCAALCPAVIHSHGGVNREPKGGTMSGGLGIALATARERVDALTDGRAAELDRSLDVTFHDHFLYQELQAHAHAAGELSTSDARLVYLALGAGYNPSNGGWSAGTDTATKVVVTLLIGRLLCGR